MGEDKQGNKEVLCSKNQQSALHVGAPTVLRSKGPPLLSTAGMTQQTRQHKRETSHLSSAGT